MLHISSLMYHLPVPFAKVVPTVKFKLDTKLSHVLGVPIMVTDPNGVESLLHLNTCDICFIFHEQGMQDSELSDISKSAVYGCHGCSIILEVIMRTKHGQSLSNRMKVRLQVRNGYFSVNIPSYPLNWLPIAIFILPGNHLVPTVMLPA